MAGRRRRLAAAMLCAALLLCGCQRVTKERLQLREDGVARLDAMDYQGALEAFEKAVAEAKRVTDFEVDVLKYRAEAEFGMKDYDAALYTYGTLEKLDQKRPEYSYLGAVCLAKKGDTAGAEEKLGEGMELEGADKAGKGGVQAGPHAPGYAQALTALGDAYRDAGKAEEAQAVYETLRNSGLATAALCNQLALACMKSQDYEQALQYIAEGLALSDVDAKQDLSFNRAVCLEYLGRYEEALAAFREYVSAYGGSEEAEHEIAFLESR